MEKPLLKFLFCSFFNSLSVSTMSKKIFIKLFSFIVFLKAKQLINFTILTFFFNSVKKKKKRPKLVLHHETFSVKTFLAKYKISVLHHPPYPPDLASCDFYLFPKIKSALNKTLGRSLQKKTSSTVTNNGKLTWSSVKIEEECTLKRKINKYV